MWDVKSLGNGCQAAVLGDLRASAALLQCCLPPKSHGVCARVPPWFVRSGKMILAYSQPGWVKMERAPSARCPEILVR